MSTELRAIADAAKAEHEKAIQARRVAEFEWKTASAEAEEARKRSRKAAEALEAAAEAQRVASDKADVAFFKLAQSTMISTGKVQG